MSWLPLTDADVVNPQDTLRIRILGGYVEIGVSEAVVRAYLSDYTLLGIRSVRRILFTGYDVEASPLGQLTVKEVRDMVTFALEQMRNQWSIAAPGMQVAEISVKHGWDIELPTSTTIGLVAITVIIVIGFALWNQYRR